MTFCYKYNKIRVAGGRSPEKSTIQNMDFKSVYGSQVYQIVYSILKLLLQNMTIVTASKAKVALFDRTRK